MQKSTHSLYDWSGQQIAMDENWCLLFVKGRRRRRKFVISFEVGVNQESEFDWDSFYNNLVYVNKKEVFRSINLICSVFFHSLREYGIFYWFIVKVQDRWTYASQDESIGSAMVAEWSSWTSTGCVKSHLQLL